MSSLAGLQASSHCEQNVNAVPGSDSSRSSTFCPSCYNKHLNCKNQDEFLAQKQTIRSYCKTSWRIATFRNHSRPANRNMWQISCKLMRRHSFGSLSDFLSGKLGLMALACHKAHQIRLGLVLRVKRRKSENKENQITFSDILENDYEIVSADDWLNANSR